MIPGITNLPVASITVALDGAFTVLPNLSDLSVLDVDAAVLNVAVGDRHHHSVLDQYVAMRRRGRLLRPTPEGAARRERVLREPPVKAIL